MGDCSQRVHLAVPVEAIVAIAPLADGKEATISTWIKGVGWAGDEIGRDV
jgi:hypothetical protein